MSDTSMTPWAWRVKIWILVGCLFFLWGCVSGQQGNNAVTPETVMVKKTLMSMASMPEHNAVRLLGNEKLVYTAIRQELPRAVVLYLPQTMIGDGVKDVVLQSGPITFVSARPVAQNSSTVKIEILVSQEFEYEVLEAENEIQVLFSFKNPMGQSMANDDLAPAVAGGNDGLVMGKDAQGNTVIFTQEPLPGEQSGAEISQTSSLVLANENIGSETVSFDEPNEPMGTGARTALTDIRFHAAETGESTLILETGHPVAYDIKRNGDNEIKLYLKNTNIPARHQRPLITTYFNSAVEQVLPVQAGGAEKKSYILIQLRHETPYRISRDANRLLIVFEPVSMTVPEFQQAMVVLNKGEKQSLSINDDSPLPEETLPEVGTKEIINPTAPPLKNSSPVSVAMETSDQVLHSIKNPSKYTGEKISLDFYETDIKNVFRILRTISGENFAIDKDVTGNVTLALDRPVPWDQVLDLILKMNGLGKVREGNIIRIATQGTLAKESKFEQETMAAKQRALTEQQQLEPVVTEYIPINYSDAIKDIEPHLKERLTKDRGSVSTNERTNMIIITDVRQKIDEAKNLIHRLDKVTPQIMIQARVVEVNKDFSRELGIAWGMSSKDVYRSDLGGTYGFDVAMNYPAAATSSLSYTFDRIVGTPFSINATLTAAEAKNDVKIVSSPRILTLDNKKATITQGLQYPYQTVDDQGNPDTAFKDIDLTLEVTPHVTPDQRVSMQLNITKNDVSGFAATGEPVISTNEATTELLVNDGNTIVIGGVVKRTTTEDMNGFPFLSDIPILGHLFRSDGNSDVKNELLIFLTPTIVQLEQKMQE